MHDRIFPLMVLVAGSGCAVQAAVEPTDQIIVSLKAAADRPLDAVLDDLSQLAEQPLKLVLKRDDGTVVLKLGSKLDAAAMSKLLLKLKQSKEVRWAEPDAIRRLMPVRPVHPGL